MNAWQIRETFDEAIGHLIKHHNSSLQIVPGCECQVCGSGEIFKRLELAKNATYELIKLFGACDAVLYRLIETRNCDAFATNEAFDKAAAVREKLAEYRLPKAIPSPRPERKRPNNPWGICSLCSSPIGHGAGRFILFNGEKRTVHRKCQNKQEAA